MDIHVFDRDFNILGIIDDYTSCIWTTKYNECGDFELYVSASCEMVTLLKENRYLVRSTDITVANGVTTYKKVMIIKNISLSTNVESGDYLTVTGRELKFILNSRIIWNMTNLVGNVGDCVNRIVTENCINPTATKRKIPHLTVSSVPPEIVEATGKQYTGTNVMTAIEEMCVTYGLGYTVNVVINNGVVSMPLQLYKGANRSYLQNVNPVVLFSDSYDNLYSTEYGLNTETFCNAAKIGGEGEGTERIYTEIGTATGLDRYEIFVDAKDIRSENNPDIEAIVAQIRADISDTEAQITTVNENITTAETELTTLNVDIANLKADISEIQNSVNELNRDIASLLSARRELETEIAQLNINNNILLAEIEMANRQLEAAIAIHDENKIQELTAKINTLQSRLESNKNTISGLVSQVDEITGLISNETIVRDGLNGQLNTLNSGLNSLNSQLTNLETYYNNLKYTLYTLNSRLTNLNNQLDAAINYSYVELLKERGRDKLAETEINEEFSGEILEDVAYKLGVDYNLGDIVSVISDYGISVNSRILSIIESVSEDGTVSIIPNFGTWEG